MHDSEREQLEKQIGALRGRVRELESLEAASALRESEERLRLAVQAGRLATWDLDVAANKARVSDNYGPMHGRPHGFQPATFDEFRDLLHPECREHVSQLYADMLRPRPETDFSTEYRVVWPDGSEHWLSASLHVHRDTADRPVRIVGVTRDITQSKRAEDDVLQRYEQLAHLSRLTTMGEMAAGLAHELNQPLYAVMNFADACAEVLKSGEPDVPRLREWNSQIAEQARRAGEIVRRLTNFVRKAPPVRTAADLNEIVMESIALVSAEINRRRVQLRLTLAPALPKVSVDRVQIEQVLVNLLRNAGEAMTEDWPERLVTVETFQAAADQVGVAVRDTGHGLSAVELRQIFEPFFTTKPDGLGMGLVVSRSIIEAHGGSLAASANPDRGATFRLTLPVGKEQAKP